MEEDNGEGFMAHTAIQRIGKNIKKIRARRKLSQIELAKKSKVSLNTIVFLENHRSDNPTIKTLLHVSTALRVKIDDLLK